MTNCKKWKCQVNVSCKEDCHECVLGIQQKCEDCIHCEDCSMDEQERMMYP